MAALATLQDNFSAALDTSKWTAFLAPGSSAVATVSGRLRITHDINNDYPAFPPPATGVHSSLGEIGGSSVYARVWPHAADEPWKLITIFGVINPTNNEGFGWWFSNGQIAPKIWNDVDDEWQIDVSAAITYDATNFAWLRLRHDATGGGTFYWDTAPDNGSGAPGTWTNRYSYLTSSVTSFDDLAGFLGTGGAAIRFSHHHYDNSIAGAYTPPEFDGVNTSLAPTAVTHATSGALAPGRPPVVTTGTTKRFRAHPASGVLAPAPKPVITTGTTKRFRAHATTAPLLAAPPPTLTASAARTAAPPPPANTHNTSGALEARAGALAGAAARKRVMSTSGVLRPGSAALAGSAARVTPATGISALSDDFAGPALNAAKWTFQNTAQVGGATNGTQDIVSGRLRLYGTTPDAYDGDAAIVSVNAYPFTGGELAGRVSFNTNPELVECQWRVQDAADPAVSVLISISQGGLYCLGTDGVHSYNIVVSNGAYDPVAHAWVRLRESGGTIYWETAPDAAGGVPGAWTVQHSIATSALHFSPASVRAEIRRRIMSSSLPSASDGILLVDGVNTGSSYVAVNHGTSGALRGHRSTLVAPAGHGGVAAIKDSFDGSTLDLAKWQPQTIQGGGAASQAGGRLLIGITTGNQADRIIVSSVLTGTLIGQAAFARLAVPMQTPGSAMGAEAGFDLVEPGTGNSVGWHQQSHGTMEVQRRVSGSVVDTVPYSYTPSTHAWLRVRETGGQLLWESAPEWAADPPAESDWVVRHQMPTADVGFPLTNLFIRLMSQIWGTPGAPPVTTPAWESVNTQTRSPQAHATSGALQAARGGLLAAAAAKKVLHTATGALRPSKAALATTARRERIHRTQGVLEGGSAIIDAHSSTSDVTRKIWFDTQDTAGAWSEPPQPADPWTMSEDPGGGWGS